MIKTLEDVERYSQDQAGLSPETADHVELRRPGLTDLEAAALGRQLPGLSDDYLEIVRTWQLDGISIGYFNLWPGRFGSSSGFAARLVAANSPENPAFGLMRASQMLEVASFESDPVCLKATDTAMGRQVFWFPSHTLSRQPRFLACNFGDLLKAATELHAFSMSDRGADGIPGFISAITAYIPERGLDEWRDLASMVIL